MGASSFETRISAERTRNNGVFRTLVYNKPMRLSLEIPQDWNSRQKFTIKLQVYLPVDISCVFGFSLHAD